VPSKLGRHFFYHHIFLNTPRINIYHGVAVANVPIDAAQYLQDTLSTHRIRILTGKGHFLFLKQWEEILSTLVGIQKTDQEKLKMPDK